MEKNRHLAEQQLLAKMKRLQADYDELKNVVVKLTDSLDSANATITAFRSVIEQFQKQNPEDEEDEEEY